LLYNAPRAASIKANEDVVLFSLDRECFNNIVKDSAVKKREKYNDILKKIELLQGLDDYEISQMIDPLRVAEFKAGQTIIKQVKFYKNYFYLSLNRRETILLKG
jgi:cAMP-dependent protein kinase regulator